MGIWQRPALTALESQEQAVLAWVHLAPAGHDGFSKTFPNRCRVAEGEDSSEEGE